MKWFMRQHDRGAVVRAVPPSEVTISSYAPSACRRGPCIADRDGAGAEAGRRDRARRIELAERRKHAGIDDMRGREIVVDARGKLRVDHCARRHDELDRVEHAGIHRDGRVGGGDHRQQRHRLGGGTGVLTGPFACASVPEKSRVSRSPCLRAVTLMRTGFERSAPSWSSSASALLLAVGPARKLGAHPRRRALEQACHRRAQGFGAILVAQRAQPFGAEPRAADLAAQIADDHLGHPAVVAQDRLDLAIDAVLVQ